MAFGTILEQNIPGYDYETWVLSGLIVWIPVSGALSISQNLLSNNVRRFRINNLYLSTNLYIQILLFPSYVMSIIAVITLALLEDTATSSIYILSKCLLIILVLSPLLAVMAYLLAYLCSLARDFRTLIPLLSQFILFSSPIFYGNKTPNSTLEKLVNILNPMNSILKIIREILFENKGISFTIIFYLLGICFVYFIFRKYVKYSNLYLVFSLAKNPDVNENEDEI